LEEERRLFYVAVTRAKSQLYFSYAKYRRLYGTFYFTKPSEFLQKLNPDTYIRDDADPGLMMQPRSERKRKPVITESMKTYKIGQKVQHPEYGEGTILNVDGEGGSARLTISFKSGKLARIIGSFLTNQDEL
jgi:DNA helicase-2/ATP-dependent DNA helicase PcrA